MQLKIAKHKVKLLGAIMSSVIVLSACGNAEGIYDEKGQVFRKVIPQDMASLDPAKVTDTVSFDKFSQVYEGLYTAGKMIKPNRALHKETLKLQTGVKLGRFTYVKMPNGQMEIR